MTKDRQRGPGADGAESLPTAIQRPKVCLVTLQPVSAKAFLLPLIRELLGRGYDVHLVTSPGGEDGHPDIESCDGLAIHRVPMPQGISPWADLCAVVGLWRHFRSEHYMVVHAHMSKCASLVLPAAWLARVPVRFYTNHGMAFLSASGWRRNMLRLIEGMSCRFAQCVYFVSFSNRDAAVAERVVPAGKAAVLALGSIRGVDAARFAPSPERQAVGRALRAKLGIGDHVFLVGHVGRAVAHKGYGITVRMWLRHFAGDSGVHLLLVGSKVSNLRALARSQPENLIVVEWTDRMEDYYAAMDCVVMPSLHEGLGYTLLEAGAAGRPVIGSRIPGILDAIEDQVTGLLVPPGDEAALAEAIRRLRADPELCRRLGAAGQVRVRERYDERRVCRAFGDEYDRRCRAGVALGET